MNLLLALLIPSIPAWAWLERVVPMGIPSRRSLLTGYSLLLGMLLVTLLMRLLSLLGVPFSLNNVGLAALALLLAGLLAPSSWRTPAWPQATPAAPGPGRWQYTLIALLVALIAARLLALGIEAGTRPVWAWDARQHWAKQAKVFFELSGTAPYVSLEKWLTMGDRGVYTNLHPDYPIATPLLQAWVGTALGEWHDSLVNLPWIVMFAALGLIFYGQARAAGLDAVTACAGTYMVLSLPYLNIHVALAGYADLLLSTCFAGAVAALALWSASRNQGHAILAGLCGLSCLLVKNEGFYWMLSLLPGFIVAVLGLKRSLATGAALLVGLVITLWILPGDLVIAGHTLDDTALGYRPDAWGPLVKSFFLHDNWHFLAWLFVAAVLLMPLVGPHRFTRLAPVAASLLCTIGLYLALYLLTRHAAGAVGFTSLNRVALHLAPAAGFFVLLVFAALVERNRENS